MSVQDHWYHRRKAAGLCLGHEFCKRPRVPGRPMCQHCLDVKARSQSKSQKALYYERKAAGICVHSGCGVKTQDRSVCPKHTAARNAPRDKAKYIAKHRAAERRRREARKAAGKCWVCTRPLWSKTLCRVHLAEHNARNAAKRRAGGTPQTTKKCSICREPGHKRDGCQYNIARERPLDLVELESSGKARDAVANWSIG